MDAHEHEPRHCEVSDLFKDKGSPPEVIDDLAAYLRHFVAPVRRDGDPSGEQLCFHCGKTLTGLMSAFMGGGFTWGLAHGEGHCAACKWPARGHHFIKDRHGEELLTMRNFVLSYHPDEVETSADAPAEDTHPSDGSQFGLGA